MRIGIDGYEANTLNRVGVNQYAYQIIKHLYILDTKNKYTVFLPQNPLSDMPKTRENWSYCIGNAGSFWTIKELPCLINKHKPDIFFSPTHYLPWFIRIPKIMAIMDLSYLHYPKMFRKKDLLKLKYLTWLSIIRAQKVLTISEFTKNEIIKHYNFPKKDISVTYPGITEYNISSKTNSTSFLPQKYILFVGTIQPRKNIENMIIAFETLKHGVHLVIVGKKGWQWENIFKTIDNSPKKQIIHYLDFINNDDFPSLYRNARCLILPSFYEGFGIPVLEAMSFGCPVVISKNSSLEEVAGVHGIYFDPHNIHDIAKGILTAIQLNQNQRDKLSRTLIHRANIFRWEKCAEKTVKIFEELKNER